MKMTEKRLILMRAAQNEQAFAGRASFKSKRDFVVTVDFEAGNFNAQFDDLEKAGLLVLGSRTDGVWGPRYVRITAKGQEVLKNL